MTGTTPRHGERDAGRRHAEAPGADRIVVQHNGGESYAVRVRGHEVIVDQPVPGGGDDRGPTPVELFVTALSTCVAYYAGSFLTRHGLTREGLRVTAEFDMTKGPPARVRSVLVRVVPPIGLGTAQREALRAVTNHCTVSNSLRLPPEVSVVIDGPGVSSMPTA